MSRNEKLLSDAAAYVDRLVCFRHAESRLNECKIDADTQKRKLEDCRLALSQHVGKNIDNRCAVLAGGRVVVIQYTGVEVAHVKVFEPEGEEIR